MASEELQHSRSFFSGSRSFFDGSRSHVAETSFTTAAGSYYASALSHSGIQTETFDEKLQQTKRWIYNIHEGLICGRSYIDWLLVIACYLVFYAILFGINTVFCAIFYRAIHWNRPTHYGPASLLQTPGLGYRPQPDVTNTLIRFLKNDGSSYAHYLDHIEAYIQYYENDLQQGDSFTDCAPITGRRTTELNKACSFDITKMSGDCIKQQNYGFDDGQPCILLKLNRVYDWVPEEYTNDTVPAVIRDRWIQANDPYWIYVQCDGDDYTTRENMGQLTYLPSNGFHFKYFPFRNQQSYRSPLMFLRFENPTPGVLLMMTCRAYAKNINHDADDKITGSATIHFEVLVD